MLDLFQTPLYIRLSPSRLTVRNVKTGAFVSEVPEIAISRGPKPKVLGAGDEAAPYKSSSSALVSNPFSHPRTLVSDFTLGQQLLKAFIKKLPKSHLLAAAPRMVFHPQGDPAGGFTQIEIRALHEMALGAGASEVTIWQGQDLTDEQVLSRDYPPTGRVLE
ncbi:rod shape-determining protein [Polaromonas sp. JS666]|uniref:rod shape-determining protein n=1 Tax=Polaromonas sp. (strain JS666 / ATCC BAA-500) TaxID=296591 RepID=UPI00087FF739|nr:rod shape-determining protein [Polaromonas sp. JS666]SDM41921.1 rod shape-determining protein MreB [Polaromonas sp. JS666]